MGIRRQVPELAYHYFSNGLRFASDRRLVGAPESPLPTGAAPDVIVAFEDVPLSRLDGDRAAEEFMVFANGDAAACYGPGRIFVSGGARISLDLAPDASEAWIGSVVFGLAIALILHQRRSPPLHCACVADGAGAMLLFGDSGAGKSTTALLFRERGWRILAEDMIALDFDNQVVGAHPSAGLARFWRESSDGVRPEAMGETLQMGAFPKTVIAFGDDGPPAPVPIRAAYFLEWLHPAEGPAEVARIAPMQALMGLRASVYRGGLVSVLGLEGDYMKKLGRLATQAPSFALRRPRSFENMAWLDRLMSWSDLS
jgi:hypothetical protein